MKRLLLPGILAAAMIATAGCSMNRTINADGRVSLPTLAAPDSRAVVEDYLKAASAADGSRMLALVAAAERDGETADSMRKTAADRYSPSMEWEILKTEEDAAAGKVIVNFKGAEVDPNPYTFTLTRENDAWRILDSPELNEREKKGDIRIKL